MFSEWRKRSKICDYLLGSHPLRWGSKRAIHTDLAYYLARAAYKAGVRAGIKQEQARRKK